MIGRRLRLAALLAVPAILSGFTVSPATAQERAAGAPLAACSAEISAPWQPPGGVMLRIMATGAGADCAIANVTLTVTSASGAVLLTFASAAADLPPVFDDATTSATMRAALLRWIVHSLGHTTRDLPIWAEGQDEPGAGAFHPEPAIMRGRYTELRRWGQPTFCFVQGSNSEGCYALDVKKEVLTLIGTRDFIE